MHNTYIVKYNVYQHQMKKLSMGYYSNPLLNYRFLLKATVRLSYE